MLEIVRNPDLIERKQVEDAIAEIEQIDVWALPKDERTAEHIKAMVLEIIDKYRGTDEITEHYKKLGEYYNGKDV